MRVLVTLLASFVLALGLLGAALTLLHTLPRKPSPTSPTLQFTPPTGLEVMPRPIEERVETSGPTEASFEKTNQGELRLTGQVLIPAEKMIALKLIREDDEIGLFMRRLDLGKQRDFHVEGLAPGKYRLQVHESESGHVLIDKEFRLDGDREMRLSPDMIHLVRELKFSPHEGSLQDGAILILEDGRFFHQRIRGGTGGLFRSKGLPEGEIRYTIRGRLDPKASKLLWKGSLSIMAARITKDAKALPPLEIKLGPAEKDPVD